MIMNQPAIWVVGMVAVLLGSSRQAIGQQLDGAIPIKAGEINNKHSRVFILASGTGVGQSHGVEGKLSSAHLELGATENAGQMTFDMASFDVDTPKARKAVGLKGSAANWAIKKVNAEIHGEKILNSARFPKSTFIVESAVFTGTDRRTQLPVYQLTGLFTLRDKTNRINFPISVRREKDWLHIVGRFKFKQSDYGITPFSGGFGTLGIADELEVFGDLWVATGQDSVASPN